MKMRPRNDIQYWRVVVEKNSHRTTVYHLLFLMIRISCSLSQQATECEQRQYQARDSSGYVIIAQNPRTCIFDQKRYQHHFCEEHLISLHAFHIYFRL